MKNWDTLEPDRVKLLNKYFTPSCDCGRKGPLKAVGDSE